MVRYCGNCGAGIKPDDRHCGACGAAIPSAKVSEADPAAVAQPSPSLRQSASTIDELTGPTRVGEVDYDPAIIQEYADAMYRRAKWLVFISTIMGGLTGLIVASLIAIAASFGRGGSDPSFVFLMCVAIGGFFGYWNGTQKAFWFKLAAQVALCQVEIEHNTRMLRVPA